MILLLTFMKQLDKWYHQRTTETSLIKLLTLCPAQLAIYIAELQYLQRSCMLHLGLLAAVRDIQQPAGEFNNGDGAKTSTYRSINLN